MLNVRPRTAPPKQQAPRSLNEIFALYLARELADEKRLGWYVKLANKHPLCLLLNALRRARSRLGRERVSGEDFAEAVRVLDREEGPL